MHQPALIAALSLTALALLAPASRCAQAAQTVTGTIRVTACLPSFSDGGVADFGDLPADTLAGGRYRVLPGKSIGFSIRCDVPTRIALKAIDNRAASLAANASGTDDAHSYGLGRTGAGKIGAYTLQFMPERASTDGLAATRLVSVDGNRSWAVDGADSLLGHDRSYAWSNAGGAAPLPTPFRHMAASLWIRPCLPPPDTFPAGASLPLDGSATLEMQYL